MPENAVTEEDEWTPRQGLRRALVWGLLTAGVIAGLTDLVAWYSPITMQHLLLRTALAFVGSWVLFAVVHRAAGMVGGACSALVLVLMGLVLVSHHAVFAIHGVPTRDGGLLIGWVVWLNPLVLGFISGLPLLIGGGPCAAYCHRHGARLELLTEFFGQRIR